VKPNGGTEKSHGCCAQGRREDSQSKLDAELVPRGVLVGGAGRLGFLSYRRTYDASNEPIHALAPIEDRPRMPEERIEVPPRPFFETFARRGQCVDVGLEA
jgi:hypothetical protein